LVGLAHRSVDLIKVRLSNAVLVLLDLTVACAVGVVLEVDLLRHVLSAGNWTCYLQLLQGHLLAGVCLVLLRWPHVHVRVFGALKPPLRVLGPFGCTCVDLGSFRNQAILRVVLVDNSIKRSEVIFIANVHLLIQFELVA